ncbi:MAG: pyruvate synthase subunit beta [Elusimicrobia bacterium]|nr:pyruvate synthase subunit beta [Elusimicrobiota bacterium]
MNHLQGGFLPHRDGEAGAHKETLSPGHLACAGCGLMPAVKLLQQVLGPRTIFVVPACCYSVIDGAYPSSATGMPVMHCAFETAASSASGVRAGLETLGIRDVTVVALAGDGGTFDIGLQALSSAAERNEDILYFCYDNEAYMNTGIQRSSATPRFSWTTTTPEAIPKAERKKDLGAILAAHRIPYFATASLAYPEDLRRKLKTAKEMKGLRVIHYFCPCPTGWKSDPRHMVRLARLAVESRVFPLHEVFEGECWVLNMDPQPVPAGKYLELQGRFGGRTPDQEAAIQKEVDENWKRLMRKVKAC